MAKESTGINNSPWTMRKRKAVQTVQHYMVIERFRPGCAEKIYARMASNGRMIPDGVQFVSSWIADDLTVCWQIMQAETRDHLDAWISKWEDLVEFDVTPVITSEQAAAKAAGTSN